MGTTSLAPSGGKADLPLPGVAQSLALWVRIFTLIWVLNYINKVTAFNVQNHLFKAETTFRFQPFIFIMIPFIICHRAKLSTMCAICQHKGWYFEVERLRSLARLAAPAKRGRMQCC